MRRTGAYPRWWVCPLKIALHQGAPILPSFQDASERCSELPQDVVSNACKSPLCRRVCGRKEGEATDCWRLGFGRKPHFKYFKFKNSLPECLFQVHLKRAFLGPVSCHTSHRCSRLRMAAVLFDERNGIQKLISPVCELSEMCGRLGSPVP